MHLNFNKKTDSKQLTLIDLADYLLYNLAISRTQKYKND